MSENVLHLPRARRIARAGWLVALLAAACSSAPEGDARAPSAPDAIGEAQAYLQTYGYLPSDALKASAPTIKFMVDQPFESGVLDDATRKALKSFQGHFGLPVSGEVDQATREAMGEARCGNPDAPVGEEAGHDDDHDKFALGAKLTRGTATIRVLRYPDGVTRSLVDNDIASAAEKYRRRSGMYFLPTTSTSISSGTWQVQVWFYSGAGPSNRPADCPNWASRPDSLAVVPATFNVSSGEHVGNTILLCVNTGKALTYGTQFDANKYDFENVFIHELGHAAGLKHSSVSGAIMWPTVERGVQTRELTKDDLLALWARWGSFAEMQGSSRTLDLAYSPTGNELWVVLENGSIWKRTNTSRNQTGSVSGTWTRVDGTATRITHDGKRPWVVNAAGDVFWRNDQGTGWNLAPGCGRDIAGSDAKANWVIAGCDGALYKLDGNQALNVGRPPANATRITLNDRSVIVVDANNNVYLNNLSTPMANTKMKDVDFGRDGNLWGIGTNNRPRLLNVQAFIPGTGDDPNDTDEGGAPARSEFVDYPGTAYAISGNISGQPTIVNEFRTISDIRVFYSN